MRRARLATTAFTTISALVLAAAPAFAHGGTYKAPGSGGPGGGNPGGGGPTTGGGGVPPGTADAPGPVTAWESWWAANKEVHLRLADGMREVGGVTTPKDGESAESVADARDVRAAELRQALVPLFLEALGDDSFEVRTAAAIALGKTGDAAGSVPLTRAAVEDSHKDVRDSAVLALGLLGRQRDLPFLDRTLNDEKAATRHRSFAAFSLGLLGGDDAAASLLNFLDGPAGVGVGREQPPLVASVIVALGLNGSPDVVPALRAALDDPRHDDQVRAFTLLALGRVADRGSLDRVIGVLSREKDARLRRAAAVALGRIANAKDAAATSALVDALWNDNDPVTRHFAAVSVGGLGDDAILALLRKGFPKAEPRDRPFVALALALGRDAASAPLLRKALVDEAHESPRSGFALALGLLGDTDSRELLEREVRDRGRIWLQGYSALALGMLRCRESAPVLRAELDRSNDPRLRANLAVALGLLRDPKAQEVLLETLRGDGSIYERGGAAMSLGLLRMDRAVPSLVERWRDRKEQELVRAFSVVALGVIADPSDVPKLARFSIDHDPSLVNDPLNEVLSIY